MYFYPDNIQETISVFQNGEFDYNLIDKKTKERSNVLPLRNRLERGIAAFPEEIADRLIKLFS